MIYPPKLKAGDTVALVAPARRVSRDQLAPALTTLKSWGLKPLLAQHIFSSGHGYLAGTDRERSADLQTMLDDDNVKAIFSARGGYGSTRIIDTIDFGSTPKWIVGFSDITAFHLRLASIGIASIHGTMPIFFGRATAADSVASLRDILFSGTCEITVGHDDFNRTGRAEGTVIGGNLSLIVDALDTPSSPDTRNRILIVEEVDEYFYKLDRMFTQLRRSGKLKPLAGLVIGHMTDIKNPELGFGETVAEIVLHAVRDYNFPVAFSFPSGHADPNLAWIHGGHAALQVGVGKTTLSYSRI